MVEIIAGDHRGETGRVMKVVPDKDRVYVEGINLAHKHVRPSQRNPQGGRIRVERPIHISNVLPLHPKSSTGTRVRYEKDAEYMALSRHLLPEFPRQKRVAKKPRDIAGTIQARDKPLVLGSRGLEIKSFEAMSYIKLEFDFYHHLQKHYPIPAPSVPEEKIDSQGEYTKYTKEFIFHPTRQALNRLKQVDFQEPEPQEEMPTLEKIQETHLRLSRKRPTQLILHRSDKALDLLYGNERVNRNAFQKW